MNVQQARWSRLVGLAFVLGVHGIVLYALWSARLIPAPEEATTLFVRFITPSQPAVRVQPPPRQLPPPKPVKQETPRPPVPHRHLVVEAAVAPADFVMPLPPAVPVIEAPPAPLAAPDPSPAEPTGPVTLQGELALGCPTRTPPKYPALARRTGESGDVVLRVELDTDGRVSAAHIATSSGFRRLDEAALNAVKTWRCNPPLRDGRAVRAIALQPFKFNLE